MAFEARTKTEPAGPIKDDPGSLRILQITDTHLFADVGGTLAGVTTDRTHAQVIERVLAEHWPVDCILATGDLVHDGTESGYRRFKRNFEALGVRTLVIPGNHDDPAAMRRVFDRGRVTWSDNAVLGNWQFIMLNSWQAGSAGGRLGEAQLALLAQHLERHPRQHALIALHHHPVAMDSLWIDGIGLADGAELMALVDRYPQVRAVVWGHVHQAFDATRGGVRLLGCPSTCIQFRPRSAEFAVDDRPPGFRWLQLHADGRIDTAVYRLPRGADVDVQCRGYN
jgi:Icc protein